MYKNYIKAFLITFLSIFILTFILSIFSYFNITSASLDNILKILILVISVAIGGITIGLLSSEKGFRNGLVLGSIISILLIVYSLFIHTFNISNLLYYLIIIISSMVSASIGINIKKTENKKA